MCNLEKEHKGPIKYLGAVRKLNIRFLQMKGGHLSGT